MLNYAERRVRVGYWLGWIWLGFGVIFALGSIVNSDFIGLAAGCIVIGALILAASLMREYMVRKSKVGPNGTGQRYR
ncbi:MAG: hypothetical protein AMXMBFR82_18090 [Candidatus Hydrogenedentota bacterium]